MDKAMDVVREIAEKLGCTLEEAWPHVVNAMYWRGVASLIIGVSIVLLFSMLFFVSFKLYRVPDGNKWKEETHYSHEAEPYRILGIVGFVVSFVGFLITISVSLYNAVPLLANPVGETILRLVGR